MRLALLGRPIGHSRSPAIHNAALDAVGITGSYVARDVDEEGLAAAVAELRSGVLDGANVTMPHKGRAAVWADSADAITARLGAANTLWHTPQGAAAGNTDVAGIREMVDAMPAGPVLVLGAGGAAAAALVAAEDRVLAVAARDPGRAGVLVRKLGIEAAVVEWDQPWQPAVVVNATPLGMHGEGLPPIRMEDAAGLVDLAYGADTTPAVATAVAAGIPHADGLDMLVAQAAAAFTIWTGREAPRAVMEEAARGEGG